MSIESIDVPGLHVYGTVHVLRCPVTAVTGEALGPFGVSNAERLLIFLMSL